jgi:thiol-disulfide isomerase/thioredoxin
VAFSADWCPDCQATIPILVKFTEHNNNIHLHIIDRDENVTLIDDFRIAGRPRVPTIFFMDNDFLEIGRWIEKSTYGYRLLLDAKRRAMVENQDDHRPILRESIKSNSRFLVKENKEELVSLLNRVFYIINGSANKDQLLNLSKSEIISSQD